MDYNKLINNISHYADILAIPFFMLLTIYFYNIKDKTLLEYFLLLFSFAGFILDSFFTYLFFDKKKF
jgi:hypothetical protein